MCAEHIANVSLTASQQHKANQEQRMEAKGEGAALGTGVEFFVLEVMGKGLVFYSNWNEKTLEALGRDVIWCDLFLKDHHGSCIVNEEGKVREIQAQIYYFVLDYNVSHRTSTLVSWLQFSLSFYPVTSSSSIYFFIILSSRHDLPSYLLWWFYQLLNYLSIYSSHGLTLLGYRNMSYYLY